MANEIKWDALEHSQSTLKGKHVILVAYKSAGMGQNKVVGVVPLYDLRDANLDGSVSLPERFYGSELYNPSGLISLMNGSNAAACVADAARQKNDLELFNQAKTAFLQVAFKVCQKALVEMMVQNSLAPGVKLSLAKTGLAEYGKVSSVANFLVVKAMEKAVVGSICR
ncbi:MAG: hypothetical protein LH614_01625 [Pyrinomonadaceae bacterium]|nr:hypothetical protein [Pyrinomonadaceae bacterium]